MPLGVVIAGKGFVAVAAEVLLLRLCLLLPDTSGLGAPGLPSSGLNWNYGEDPSLEMKEVESQPLDWEEGAVLEQREEGSDSHSERGERATTDVGEAVWAG